ncbi:hypothetical protein E1281_10160 [Actinomadura sp. KC345]|uniref:hypothetical protein n=1 Tax=Actinomadura sp. KC345 TaxID=2530371 RepID=UPI001052C7F6|nr:hypothetical protein [Actinomadura sp. KC345]TDC55876.1 hypothetical protein E1281_10160 [Actinomadura sp. KC345]
MRRDTEPDWAAHLDPGPRVHLKQGLAYLSRCSLEGEFPTTRTDGVQISVHVQTKGALPALHLPFPVFTRSEWPPNPPGQSTGPLVTDAP